MDLHIHIPTPREGLRFWGALLIAVVSVALVLGWGSGDAVLAAGNSNASPDTTGNVGKYSSLELDAAGNPVISYHDQDGGDLKVMHCNDPACSGGGESITSPDGAEYVGTYTSLELDAAGNPVISYQGNVSSIPGLKIMHCNDPNCAGDDESITAPDTSFGVGEWTSLELDASGFPVVSYHDSVNRDLKVPALQ